MSEILSGESPHRTELRADCANCFGLCCVALAFVRSADFAFDKDAGEPCVNLADDFRCEIHPRLRAKGFKGCTVFDCFGAGQKVSRVTFQGTSWRQDAAQQSTMFAVFPVVRQLQELLWYLDAAIAMPQARPLRAELAAQYAEIERVTLGDADTILAVDVTASQDGVNAVLSRVSELVRAGSPRGRDAGSPRIRRGADLIGAKLGGQDLRGANLRSAYLIAASLRRADLRGADLIGADLRDADLCGADVSTALFLTQMQVNAARGDAATALPPGLVRPSHWAQ
jgi:uncharacterized protein YjbI with pentapeptide repeats